MKHLFIIVISLLVVGCIEQYQLDQNDDQKRLVVSGEITDEPGPYKVRLSYSFDFGLNQDFSQPVYNAKVWLHDSEGAREPMTSTGLGLYWTDDNGFRGKIGNQYWITIEMPDGKRYQSEPEKLLPVPGIDRVFYDSEEVIRFDPANEPYVSIRFPISVAVNDPGDERNYYRWDWNAIEEVFTIPPPSDEDTMVSQCFIIPSYKRNNDIVIAGDKVFNGNLFSQVVYHLPYDRSSRFLITISQYSLTEKAYKYWELIKQESRRSGSIFDNAPLNVRGNIYLQEDPNQRALGYFSASSKVTDTKQVIRSGLSRLPDHPRLGGDCRFVYPRAFEEKPEGFD